MASYIKTPPITSMENAFSVKGLNVVVTGGNRGIGKGIATAFCQCGANVVILCRNYESGKAAVEELKQYGTRVECFQCDISKIEDVQKAEKEVFEYFENVDVLINNAGVATNYPFLSEIGLSEWYRVIDTDLHGVANMCYYFAPHMVAAGKGGTIINTSSVGGQRAGGSKDHPNAPYMAAKAGIDHFMRYLCQEVGDAGIRVNNIAPGPFHSDLDKDLPQSFIDSIERDMPCHRFGEPIELGALCVFLASPAGVQITGQVYVSDGGLMAANG